jgi:hypothetical protein
MWAPATVRTPNILGRQDSAKSRRIAGDTSPEDGPLAPKRKKSRLCAIEVAP